MDRSGQKMLSIARSVDIQILVNNKDYLISCKYDKRMTNKTKES